MSIRVVYVQRLHSDCGIRYRGRVVAMGNKGDYLCTANACIWIESPLSFTAHYRMLWKMDADMFFCTTTLSAVEMNRDFQVFRKVREKTAMFPGQRGDEVVTFESGASFILRKRIGSQGKYDGIPLYVDTRRQKNIEIV